MIVLVQYPYLVESSILLALALGFMCCLPRRLWPLALIGGGLAVPFSLLSVVHVPAFWNPEVIWSYHASPEDALWCAAAGLNA